MGSGFTGDTSLSARAEAARILGKISTPKKAAASRRNGKLGGRPKKKEKK